MLGQTIVFSQAADQVGLGACLDHLQLVVADVFFLQALDFDVDRVPHLLRRVSGKRNGVEREQVRILDAGVGR